MTGYSDWAKKHAAIFGLTMESDKALFIAWHAVFEANRYTAGELDAATMHMASSGEILQSRQQHLAAINQYIRAKRVEKFKLNDDTRTESPSCPSCPKCLNSGFVIVPHERSMIDGCWCEPFATCSAICNCYIGNRRATSHERREVKMVRIEAYERRFPHWQDEMRMRHEAAIAMNKAIDASQRADWVGKTLKKTLKTITKPLPPEERRPPLKYATPEQAQAAVG